MFADELSEKLYPILKIPDYNISLDTKDILKKVLNDIQYTDNYNRFVDLYYNYRNSKFQNMDTLREEINNELRKNYVTILDNIYSRMLIYIYFGRPREKKI